MSKFYKDQFLFKISEELEPELRTIHPDDKEGLVQAFEALSSDSRYKRFMAYFKHLSPSMLDYLTEVDQENHVAWAATTMQKSQEIGLGVARFIRIKENPETAELAITVIDSHQSKGIGNILFAVMYHLARFHEIKYFVGSVIAENAYVLKKLQDMHAKVHADGYVYQFKMPICEDLDVCIQSKSLQKFKDTFRKVGEKLFEVI